MMSKAIPVNPVWPTNQAAGFTAELVFFSPDFVGADCFSEELGFSEEVDFSEPPADESVVLALFSEELFSEESLPPLESEDAGFLA